VTQHNIELHVEELALQGFPPVDRHRISEAVQRELTRLLSDQGLPASLEAGREFSQVDGGSFQLSTGSRAGSVGADIGRAVYGGLAK
jgi:hypothetical protein